MERKLSPDYEDDRLIKFFERLKNELTFRHWYFGHYHMDRQIDDKFTALYNQVIPLDIEREPITAKE